MKILIRNDSVHIEGYVNAVERFSKVLNSRIGKFIERISKGAFSKALARNEDVKIMLNHQRVIGSQKQGNLKLYEDPIGLRAEADITDPEVVKDAKEGNLVGWSFGFYDREVDEKDEDGIRARVVNDLDLEEVSVLNRERTPAYDGTLIMARDDNPMFYSDSDDLEITVEKEPDYSQAEEIIKEMKGE